MNKTSPFTEQDHKTWKLLFTQQDKLRDQQIIPDFGEGLDLLGITNECIPDLDLVNKKLYNLTGWQGVYVNGFEEPKTFFKMLSERKFPIGKFIRSPNNLSYTPEPDVFHDLYGHIPFYTISEYAKFSEDFGKRALKYANHSQIIEEFQRLYWFAVEFGLVDTPDGRRIFGAGIASSFTECAYALSSKPTVLPFDLENIRNRSFRIDVLQDTLYILKSPDQLYSCLNTFERAYKGF